MRDGVRATGHVQVKGNAGNRRYYALWRDADGRHQRLLGPAHVKDSGRRTARGAIVWRAGDGPLPGPEHLTPADAAATLRELLAGASKRPTAASQRSSVAVTFGEACAEWLRYIEHERKRTPSTLADYRSTVRAGLLPDSAPRRRSHGLTPRRSTPGAQGCSPRDSSLDARSRSSSPSSAESCGARSAAAGSRSTPSMTPSG